jgi:hypothetical protein
MRRMLAIFLVLGAAAFILLPAEDRLNFSTVVLQVVVAACCINTAIVLRGIVVDMESRSELVAGSTSSVQYGSNPKSVSYGSNPKVVDQLMRQHAVLQFLGQVEDRRRVRLGRDISSEW